jgi:hypothetical protein
MTKTNIYLTAKGLFAGFAFSFMAGCTKYEKGFISPTIQYSVSTVTIIKGRVFNSNTLVPDGSSIPMNVKWVHIYDSTGKIVDDLFQKKYPIEIWSSSYNAITDTNFALIMAKRTKTELPAIVVNPLSGRVEANSGTYNLPSGTYTMDLEVTNTAGTQQLKKAMTMVFKEGAAVETAPETGAYSAGTIVAGTATGGPLFFNGQNNPFVKQTIERKADSPNEFILKFVDKNGLPFNPKNSEVIKRPNGGLNPTPKFLQNLQDYAPDTYVATDEAISIKFPLTPFPIASLGNGFNMYYLINTANVQIDSTASWTTNTPGVYYQGINDSRYRGTYVNGRYDYSIRVPLRIQTPGSYVLTVQLLNTTRRQ